MRRSGFSLVEIIIVLALLVVVFAIAMPYTQMMYRDARPRAAADALRAAFLQARTHAMEEGRPYRVGILPGGSTFRVAPDSDEYWTGSGQGVPSPEGALPAYIRAKNLPGGVVFATPNSAPTPAVNSVNTPPEVDPASIDSSRFETLVVLFSDGTAEQDVEVRFDYPGTTPVVVTLRGLTGVSTVRTQVREGARNP